MTIKLTKAVEGRSLGSGHRFCIHGTSCSSSTELCLACSGHGDTSAPCAR